jgi:hypothetical protein
MYTFNRFARNLSVFFLTGTSWRTQKGGTQGDYRYPYPRIPGEDCGED